MMNRKTEKRYGMSSASWFYAATVLDILLDIVKGTIVVLGVISAALADVAMGAISVSILFGTNPSLYTKTPTWVISTVISLGASAFQIYLFSILQRRGIGFKEFRRFGKLDAELKGVVSVAGTIWLIDTFMDVAPVFLLVVNSQYKAIPWLYILMVFAVGAIVFLLCGFSEVLTSNMKGILQINDAPAASRPQNNTPRQEPRQEPKQEPRPQQSHAHEEPVYQPQIQQPKNKDAEVAAYLQKHKQKKK